MCALTVWEFVRFDGAKYLRTEIINPLLFKTIAFNALLLFNYAIGFESVSYPNESTFLFSSNIYNRIQMLKQMSPGYYTALSFIVKLCTSQGEREIERDLLGYSKSAGLTL